LRAVPAEQPGSGLHSAVLPARLGGADALLRAEPDEAGGDGGPLAHRRRRGKGPRALTAAPRPLRGEGRGSDSRPSPFPFSGTPSTRISGSPPDIGRSGHFLPDLTIHPGSRMLPDHARRPAPAFRRIW